MNVIFWVAVILGLITFWLCFAIAFRKIGKPFKHMLDVAKNEINKSDEEDMEESNHE